MENKKIVFLYSELANYFLACIKALMQEPTIELHIIRWEVNKEAPFTFQFPENLKIYSRNNFNSPSELIDLVYSINPDVIYCSGWLDKGYLKVCKKFKTKVPVIVGFDSQWKGTVKQKLAVLFSPFKILNHFTHCWVPGSLQYKFAEKLGFKKENILTGFYSCDFDLFYNQYLKNKDAKATNFPKRFVYVGRYYEFKGIKDLWQAFIELQNEMPYDWELWCFGVGDVVPINHPKIKHYGFVQPNDMPQYISQTGVFVLPSLFEPWGVVVHEFASAGFPLIVSTEVGARVEFVENDQNGFVFEAGNKDQLKTVMKKIMLMDAFDLVKMGEISVEKAKQNTPEIWAKKLMQLIQ
jgi:glycosyltransferase involved in cell wall biosynthesis